MLENLFTGIFGGLTPLFSEDKIQIREILECRDAEALRTKYVETIESLKDIASHPKFDDNYVDFEIVSQAIAHYNQMIDTRNIDDQIRDYIEDHLDLFNYTSESHKAEMMRYYPEEYQKKLPKTGAWVMVITPVGVDKDIAPIPYSVYFAKPAPLSKDITLPATSKRKESSKRIPYYRVKITTPGGDVWLWPHEYMIMVDPQMMLDEIDNSFDLIKMGGDANYDSAKIHYLATRGLSQTDAYQLLLGSINSTNHIYFRIREDAIPFWEHLILCLQHGINGKTALAIWNSEYKVIPVVTL